MVKNLPANAGDMGDVESVLGQGRSPGGGNGIPTLVFLVLVFWYSCLENPVDLESYSPCGHKESDMTEHAYMHEPVKDYISC